MDMHKTEEKPLRPERSSQRYVHFPSWFNILGRYRKDPELWESLLLSIKSSGISEEKLSQLQEKLVAWQKDWTKEVPSRAQHIDRYIIGGTGAIAIVLLPVALSAGIADTPLAIALLALVISLPLLGCSLYISFFKQEYHITSYGIDFFGGFYHLFRDDSVNLACFPHRWNSLS